MSIRETMRKAANLFVEMPPGDPAAPITAMSDAEFLASLPKSSASAPAAPKTVEQIVKESPGPNLDEIKPQAAETSATMPVLLNDGTLSYSAIYQMAKLPIEPFTAENVIELLAQLPSELPIQAKRATLKVTLDAMSKTSGASTEKVIADASRKLAALASFAESYQSQADKFVSAANSEIQKLEQQIAERKGSIDDAKSKAEKVASGCKTEADRLDDVLEFFTMDVAPSKFAP
jgi:cell division protein FtsL